MRKMLLTLFTVFTILLVSALLKPVQAGPPTTAEGLWQYTPYILGVKEAGCNTFLTTFEDGIWTGTFEGTSTEDGKVVIHCSGAWSFNAIVTFSEVTVNGREGTLTMSVVGGRPDVNTDWEGKWVILSGTGELTTLRGQGTWWGPGAPDVGQQGDIYYSGQIHFEPN